MPTPYRISRGKGWIELAIVSIHPKPINPARARCFFFHATDPPPGRVTLYYSLSPATTTAIAADTRSPHVRTPLMTHDARWLPARRPILLLLPLAIHTCTYTLVDRFYRRGNLRESEIPYKRPGRHLFRPLPTVSAGDFWFPLSPPSTRTEEWRRKCHRHRKNAKQKSIWLENNISVTSVNPTRSFAHARDKITHTD